MQSMRRHATVKSNTTRKVNGEKSIIDGSKNNKPTKNVRRNIHSSSTRTSSASLPTSTPAADRSVGPTGATVDDKSELGLHSPKEVGSIQSIPIVSTSSVNHTSTSFPSTFTVVTNVSPIDHSMNSPTQNTEDSLDHARSALALAQQMAREVPNESNRENETNSPNGLLYQNGSTSAASLLVSPQSFVALSLSPSIPIKSTTTTADSRSPPRPLNHVSSSDYVSTLLASHPVTRRAPSTVVPAWTVDSLYDHDTDNDLNLNDPIPAASSHSNSLTLDAKLSRLRAALASSRAVLSIANRKSSIMYDTSRYQTQSHPKDRQQYHHQTQPLTQSQPQPQSLFHLSRPMSPASRSISPNRPKSASTVSSISHTKHPHMQTPPHPQLRVRSPVRTNMTGSVPQQGSPQLFASIPPTSLHQHRPTGHQVRPLSSSQHSHPSQSPSSHRRPDVLSSSSSPSLDSTSSQSLSSPSDVLVEELRHRVSILESAFAQSSNAELRATELRTQNALLRERLERMEMFSAAQAEYAKHLADYPVATNVSLPSNHRITNKKTSINHTRRSFHKPMYETDMEHQRHGVTFAVHTPKRPHMQLT